MIRPAAVLLGVVIVAASGVAAQQPARAPAGGTAIAASIDRLGSFDLTTRIEAARAVRRAPATAVVPALSAAVRAHKDAYVRFRAMILLAGFGVSAAGGVVREVMGDKDDRLRMAAYQWFEYHPDPAVLPVLIAALEGERSEFVRPALTRAIAAQGTDPRARAALVPLVDRGEDFFRGAVIDALGDYDGRYAIGPIVAVATLDGPLRDDAITALGKLGDASIRDTLVSLQATVSRELQPTVAAAACLVGLDCPAQQLYLEKTLTFAATTDGVQPLLRGAVHGLGMLAVRGNESAVKALLDAGASAREVARAPIALGIGLVALRKPAFMLRILRGRADAEHAIDLLSEAFDMLSEDYEEERFYAEVRQDYWSAPAGSAERRLADLLISRLEF